MEESRVSLSYLMDLAEISQLLNKYVYMLTTMDFDHIFEECFSQTREDVSIQASDSGVLSAQSTSKSASSGSSWDI